MALSVVQSSGAVGNNGAASVAPAISTTTAGNLLVLLVYQGVAVAETVAYSVSDSRSQTWTSVVSEYVDNLDTGGQVAIWCVEDSLSVTSVTVTQTTGGSRNCLGVQFFEVSGAALSAAVDQTASNYGFDTNPSVTASETTNPSEIAFGLMAIGLDTSGAVSISSITSGWTNETQLNPQATESTIPSKTGYAAAQPSYQILSSEEVLTFGGSASAETAWGAVIATFVAAGGGPPTFTVPPPYIANQAVQRAATW